MDAKQLTTGELDFLRSQRLTASDIFDGRYLTSAAWKEKAKAAGLEFVLGTPCQKAGHRLRTRAGHCIQCDPKKIAYQRRHAAAGYVYIAGSMRGRLLKIGTAVDVAQRERNLQGQTYGGFDDWVVLFHAKVSAGGRVEGEALRRLSVYRATRQYEKDGRSQEAGELLMVSLSKAKTALGAVLQDEGQVADLWQHPRWRDYEFK